MTTNQSVVDEDGDVVEKKCQRWGWFSHQISGGHEESETNEEGIQDGQQAVPEIWDYVKQDKK